MGHRSGRDDNGASLQVGVTMELRSGRDDNPVRVTMGLRSSRDDNAGAGWQWSFALAGMTAGFCSSWGNNI